MARIDAATEQRIADRRSRLRQDRDVPLLIRDDGMLYPNTKLVAKNPRFRPYHGDPKANLEDRMRFLQGFAGKRAVTFTASADEPFDIGKADADALAEFAMDQYGAVLDPAKPIGVLREQVFKLSQLPDGPAADAAPDAPAENEAPRVRNKPGPKPKSGLNLPAD